MSDAPTQDDNYETPQVGNLGVPLVGDCNGWVLGVLWVIGDRIGLALHAGSVVALK